MLKISPTFVINCSKRLKKIIDNLKSKRERLENKFNALDSSIKDKYGCHFLDTHVLWNCSCVLEDQAILWKQLVEQLEEATGESAERLLSANYSDEYYEEKLIEHYAKISVECEQKGEFDSRLYILDKFYDFWHDNIGVDEKVSLAIENERFKRKLEEFLNCFDYEKFGFTSIDEVVDDLIYIREVRGEDKAQLVLDALVNNCPDNFSSFDFAYSEVGDVNIADYGLRGEDYNITNCTYNMDGRILHFMQVMNRDLTNTEKVVYTTIYQCNLINELGGLDKRFLDVVIPIGKETKIVLADKGHLDNKDENWCGYYVPKSNDGSFDGGNYVVLDSTCNMVYGINTSVHEFCHKYDDDYISTVWSNHQDFASKINIDKWRNMAEESFPNVAKILDPNFERNPSAPYNDSDVLEVFAETTRCYLQHGDELKVLCPDVYEMVGRMFDDYVDFNPKPLTPPDLSAFSVLSSGKEDSYPLPEPGSPPTPASTPPPV